MTMTEPKQTEGQRIVAKFSGFTEPARKTLIDEIDLALSAERLKAQGLVEALQRISFTRRTYDGRPCKNQSADIADQALSTYASAADDRGNGG